ncbi:XRE family transcriptional regulator [Kitasatospora sp. NPDC085464]|uniref:XRE family transcriptional regulator n=1 Tax=Kitasatospora sp. NPDC085464 TaxID=3364063 RepID=UPI0037CB6870
MGENLALRARMAELQLTRLELARRLNDELARITGKLGTISERTVQKWLSGKSKWPQGRIRIALTSVLERTPDQLGFIEPGVAPPPEEPVRRRSFIAIGTAAALPIPSLAAPTMVGRSDVARLRTKLDDLVALDYHLGGHTALEAAAVAGAAEALQLTKMNTSQAVGRQLLSLAADFTATAAFSAIDDRRFERAKELLKDTLTYAGLAQDSTAQLRVYNNLAVIAFQQQHWHESIAAAQAAHSLGIARRDPLAASLAHARAAIGYAAASDRQAALRYLGHAHDALNRAGQEQRPSWLDFYGRAELFALSAVVHQRLGSAEQAEGAAHQALASIPAEYRRNRASATGWLALAQLHQGELEQACATALTVRPLMGDELPPRMRSLLGDFHRDLIMVAPDSTATREWTERIRRPKERQ